MSGKEVYVGCECDRSMFKSTDRSFEHGYGQAVYAISFYR